MSGVRAAEVSVAATAPAVRSVRLLRLGNMVAYVSTFIAGIALGSIVVINGMNVIGRYFFSCPISWAEESMLYLMVLVVFSAVAAVTWKGAHIKIELLLDMFPAKARRIAAATSAALTIVISLVVAVSSLDVVSQLLAFDQRSDAMEFPVWIPQSAVLVGLLLIAAMTALRLIVFEANAGDRS